MLEKKRIQAQLEEEKAKVLKDFERNKKLLAKQQSPMGNMSFDTRTETPLDGTIYKNTQTVKAQGKGTILVRNRNTTQSSTNLHRNLKSSDGIVKEIPHEESGDNLILPGNNSKPKKISIPPRNSAHQPGQHGKSAGNKPASKFVSSPYIHGKIEFLQNV